MGEVRDQCKAIVKSGELRSEYSQKYGYYKKRFCSRKAQIEDYCRQHSAMLERKFGVVSSPESDPKSRPELLQRFHGEM